MKAFFDDLNKLKRRFVSCTPKTVRSSPDFESHCRYLFELHAELLWPPESVDRSGWLVAAEENTWEGLYSENLFAGNPAHRYM